MALVRTDVLEECITSVIVVTRIGELGTVLPMPVLTRAMWCNTPEDSIPQVEVVHFFFCLLLTGKIISWAELEKYGHTFTKGELF
jgi:hypothetical protein